MGTEIAGHVETAAQPGIAEARGELDATADKDESEQSPVSYAGPLDRQAMQQYGGADLAATLHR